MGVIDSFFDLFTKPSVKLAKAVKKDDENTIQKLLPHFHPNEKIIIDDTEITVILWAFKDNRVEYINKVIIEYPNIEKDVVDKEGNSILHYAIEKFTFGVIDHLVSKVYNLKIDIVNKHNETPLYWSIKRGDVDICNFIFRYTTKFDLQDKDGNTLLHLIAMQDLNNVIKFEELLKYMYWENCEANNILNNEGKKPIDYIKERYLSNQPLSFFDDEARKISKSLVKSLQIIEGASSNELDYPFDTILYEEILNDFLHYLRHEGNHFGDATYF